jgi:hypothetical protein
MTAPPTADGWPVAMVGVGNLGRALLGAHYLTPLDKLLLIELTLEDGDDKDEADEKGQNSFHEIHPYIINATTSLRSHRGDELRLAGEDPKTRRHSRRRVRPDSLRVSCVRVFVANGAASQA